MRTISVTTEVFARIWALRQAGEEDENSILERVLFEVDDEQRTAGPASFQVEPRPAKNFERELADMRKPTWATDLVAVLRAKGGKARLEQIYDAVEKLRRANERSLPRTLEAVVRRTLENHSSDSHNYLGG